MDPTFPVDVDIQKPKNCLTPRSFSLRRVGLCAVLANIGFPPIFFFTPLSVSLCGVTSFANISAKTNLSAKPF